MAKSRARTIILVVAILIAAVCIYWIVTSAVEVYDLGKAHAGSQGR